MNKLLLSLVVMTAAVSLSAASLYTNTWKNTEGASVVKNWGDAANWSVAHADETPAPASAVPTADSFVKMLRNASVSLLPAGDYSAGETYFLATEGGKTLNVEIPVNSRLSMEGAANRTYLGTAGWRDGEVSNKVKIDINGGEMIVDQAELRMRPNMTATTCKGYNWIQIRNGGKLTMKQGDIHLYGGSSNDSAGRGIYTNIIDVLAGSTLELQGSAILSMGAFVTRTNPHTSGYYYGSGWVNVKGGSLVAKDPTFEAPIFMTSAAAAGIGGYVNVTDGGTVDLGGKALYVTAQNTNIVRVASGGVISNFIYSVQGGPSSVASAKFHNMLEIDGGKVFMGACCFNTKDYSRGTCAVATFRLHGPDAILDLDKWEYNQSASGYNQNAVPQFFADLRLKAHTDRNADFPVRPIRTRREAWDGAHGGHLNANVHGVWRLSPDGGVQLVHKDRFELLCRKHDGQGDYKIGSTYGGFVGEDLWRTNAVTLCENRWKRYTTYEYTYVFRALLKNEAKLTDGVVLATAKPRAWLQLPKFTARQIDSNRMERISVRLKLEAPENGPLDLARIVKALQDNGHEGACADDTVAGYNVRIDLPLDELKANTTDDKVVMDFVSCETYAQAVGALPLTTNALIRAATCEPVKKPRGLLMIVR